MENMRDMTIGCVLLVAIVLGTGFVANVPLLFIMETTVFPIVVGWALTFISLLWDERERKQSK